MSMLEKVSFYTTLGAGGGMSGFRVGSAMQSRGYLGDK